MKFSCGGVLPEDLQNLAQLPSPLVLQINQMVNLNDDPHDDRLLLTMTDGVQFIYGKEIQHNKDLNVSLPPGFKVAIHKARILNGLIRLVPEGLKVLGGMVQDLGAARDKVMEEVIADREPKSYEEIVAGNTHRLSEDSEEYKAMPYTYLANLLEQHRKADGGATIRGKIQGMMTGLSEFKFGQRKEYELVVHFDDGSCTSDVLIHPKEVERQIGLTPKEISEFYYSVSDDDKWDVLTDIQARLSSLECTLAVEMYSNSNIPVAVEVDYSTFDISWVMEKRHELMQK